MAREDIELTVERNTLTLKGTRKRAADVKDEQIRRVERRYGSFSRSFALPNTVDASKVTRRLQERDPDGEAAVPRGVEAPDDHRRSRRVMRLQWGPGGARTTTRGRLTVYGRHRRPDT